MNERCLKILVVEDNLGDVRLLKTYLATTFQPKFEVTHAARLATAQSILNETGFDAILLDLGLPDSQGKATFGPIQAAAPRTPILILTGLEDDAVARELVQSGAQDYLVKGRVDEYHLPRAIMFAIERKYTLHELQASQEYLQAVLDSAADAFFVDDAETGRIIDVNRGMCEMYGYTHEEALRTPIADLSQGDPPYSQAEALEWLCKARQAGPQTFEWLAKHKDGHLFWVETSIRFAVIGGANRFVVVVRDITERQEMIAVLRRREQEFSTLANNIPDILVRFDTGLRHRYVNPILEKLTGISGADYVGKTNEELGMPPEQVAFWNRELRLVIDEATPRTLSFQFEGVDGVLRYFEAHVTPEFDAGGQVVSLLSIVRDITKQKAVEEALRDSEVRFHLMFEQHDAIMLLIEPLTGTILDANQAALNFYGYTKTELCAMLIDEVNTLPPEQVAAERQKAIGLTRNFFTFPHRLANGEERIVEVHSSPIIFQEKKVLFSIIHDVTERKRAEEAFRETSEQLTHMIANSPTVIYALKVDGDQAVPLWISENIETVLGFSADDALLTEWWPSQIHPLDRSQGLASLEHLLDDFYQHEYRFLRKDGQLVWLHDEHRMLRDAEYKPYEIIGTWTDITTRKQAEEALQEYNTRLEAEVEARTRELSEAQEQLVRQARLAVLGQMAGSVGHELRNPLAVIQNAIYFLKLIQPEASDKIRQYHSIIEQETQTAEKIITDLLDYARVKSVDQEPVAVAELIKQTLERSPASPSISVLVEIPADLPMVFVDLRQMMQVLGNLIANASQAMPDGGKLTVISSTQDNMIAIAVRDTGVGIAPENMQKIFEPLFTTKSKGIGLGLAVSQKLIEANGGRIEVASELGKGSTFTVYMPVHK